MQAKIFGVTTSRNGSLDKMFCSDFLQRGTDLGIWDPRIFCQKFAAKKKTWPSMGWPSTGVVTTKRLVASPLTVRFPISTHVQLGRKKFQ